MNIEQFIQFLHHDRSFADNAVSWFNEPAQVAKICPLPQNLHDKIIEALRKMGIESLYSHQCQAIEALQNDKHTVLVTPTASGKSLAYLIPVLDDILKHPDKRAMFLFPTKALAQDQWQLLQNLDDNGNMMIKSFTYDGDTSATARKSIRNAGQIVITNPDMLHAGILPQHSQWIKLFENLSYVVIDELHIYRGIFGSHLAHLLQRLQRVVAFYRAKPLRFILCSATIANPLEHAASLTGLPFQQLELIDENGASRGARHTVLYNPPVVQSQLGIRRSSLKEAAAIGYRAIQAGISSIFFVRSRVRVEVLANYLRRKAGSRRQGVKAYRGGYLPQERRDIEKGLRNGTIHTVVSTNALELGVDIGQLDMSVAVGFPGSMASLKQQFGRAGRSNRSSLAILIATSSPLEQFYMQQPERFYEKSIERALINPENPLIQLAHLKCAAFEIPLLHAETIGPMLVNELASFLQEEGVVKEEDGRFYWASRVFPANDVSLRSASQENFIIIEQQRGQAKVIGEVDFYAAPTTIHEHAIYLHQGQSYQIEKLDWEKRQAIARRCDPDYYTDAEEKIDFQILSEDEKIVFGNQSDQGWSLVSGDIALHRQAVLYKKIKLYSHESIGWGKIYLPEIQMHTQACWLTISIDVMTRFCAPAWQGALLAGLSFSLSRMAPAFLLCDGNDIRAKAFLRSPFSQQPMVLCYDSYPGGIALSQRLFHLVKDVLHAVSQLVVQCPCARGCPSCMGPPEMPNAPHHPASISQNGLPLDWEPKETLVRLVCHLLDAPQEQSLEVDLLETRKP